MNRYPLWKYVLIGLALLAALLYSLPNLYGSSPAVQVSALRGSPIDLALLKRVQAVLAEAKLPVKASEFDGKTIKVKLPSADYQPKAKEVLQNALGEDYVVALNLVSDTPAWMQKIGAHPMALGLDLQGGVHFLMEVDMAAAVDKRLERLAGELRRELKAEKVRFGSVKRTRGAVDVQLRDAETLAAAQKVIAKTIPNVQVVADETSNRLRLTFSEEELRKIQSDAVAQNVGALHNRINELGVAEPIIQQQGASRIVVQLPGVQDVAKAKDIIGRTASLEIRLAEMDQTMLADALAGNVPAGYELLDSVGARDKLGKTLVKKEVELTGDNINKAEPSFDQQNNPVISMGLDAAGASIFRTLSRENIGKHMAIVLVEKGKGQVITAPRINSELGGNFVIEGGGMTIEEANDISILVRSGSLAAPMTIVEERTIGPSLGQENIERGMNSVIGGFLAVVAFMILYYRGMGLISSVALFANVLCLIALLSLLGVTMTLPGIAAVALTLGMAIDSNVLINERIREEIRNGVPPQSAINAGYQHAWNTILDSNITTLIAGIALLAFGSGAVRGFAWVHCLGILTSMFSAVLVSRAITNLVYGYRRKLNKVSV
jgi:preprotein translocase subunit SecD